MQRRDEKRRKFHEALVQTLYPRSSSSSPSSSPSQVEKVDEESFDVTLINPEDYVKIDSSNQDDDNEDGDGSGIVEKPSRAQRKRLRKKMLKEEAARRSKVIGPLLPIEMIQTRDADACGRNIEEDCDGYEEEEASCSQPVRRNAQEKEEKYGDRTQKVKKRRQAKKLAKETSKESKPIHVQDPTSEISCFEAQNFM